MVGANGPPKTPTELLNETLEKLGREIAGKISEVEKRRIIEEGTTVIATYSRTAVVTNSQSSKTKQRPLRKLLEVPGQSQRQNTSVQVERPGQPTQSTTKPNAVQRRSARRNPKEPFSS